MIDGTWMRREQNESKKRNGLASEFRSIHWQFAPGGDGSEI